MSVETVKAILSESPMSLEAVGQMLCVKPSLVRHWCVSGARGGVKLEHIRIGGRYRTSEEAVHRFLAAISA